MNRDSAELVVVIAMESRARELVAVAQAPEVVDAANAEWKRLARRRALLEAASAREMNAAVAPAAPAFTEEVA